MSIFTDCPDYYIGNFFNYMKKRISDKENGKDKYTKYDDEIYILSRGYYSSNFVINDIKILAKYFRLYYPKLKYLYLHVKSIIFNNLYFNQEFIDLLPESIEHVFIFARNISNEFNLFPTSIFEKKPCRSESFSISSNVLVCVSCVDNIRDCFNCRDDYIKYFNDDSSYYLKKVYDKFVCVYNKNNSPIIPQIQPAFYLSFRPYCFFDRHKIEMILGYESLDKYLKYKYNILIGINSSWWPL